MLLCQINRLKRRDRFSSKPGFTLIEILLTLAVLAIVIALAIPLYSKVVEKIKEAEALVNIEAIRKAAIMEKINTGTYANAADTNQINELFGLGIQEHYFGYKIVDATESTFRIIATRLGSLIEGMPMMIATGPEGVITKPMEAAAGGGGSGGGSGGDSGGGTGGGGFGFGGVSGPPNNWIGLIKGGGGSYYSHSIGDAPLNFIPRGADLWTGWPDSNTLDNIGMPVTRLDGVLVPADVANTPEQISKLKEVYNILASSEMSSIADDIFRKGLSIMVGPADHFEDTNSGTIAQMVHFPYTYAGIYDEDGHLVRAPDFPGSPSTLPYMEINPAWMNYDSQLLAVILAHEGVHFGEYLDGSDIQKNVHHTLTTIDIEFRAYWNEAYYWEKIRDKYGPSFKDNSLESGIESWYQAAKNGEAYLKQKIASYQIYQN